MTKMNLSLLVAMREELVLLTRYILEEAGYRVLAAHDLDRAAEIIRHEPIRLAVVDRALADDHSEQSAALPSNFFRQLSVPLLLLGGDPFSTISVRPRELVEILEWPLPPDKLIASIRTLLRKARMD